MLSCGREDAFSTAILLLCHSFFVSFSKLSGALCYILGYFQISLFLSAFGAIYFYFSLCDEAVALCNSLIAARAFSFEEIKNFLSVGFPMTLTECPQIDCAVFAVESKLVKATMQRADNLTGSSFVEVDFKVLVESGRRSIAPVDTYHLLFAMIHLYHIHLQGQHSRLI